MYVHMWDITHRTYWSVLYVSKPELNGTRTDEDQPSYFWPIFYAVSMMLTKTAILLDWMRVFSPKGTRNFLFWTCWPVLIVNAAFYMMGILVSLVSCRPARKFWEPMIEGTCFDTHTFGFSSACVNVVLDIVILVIPQRIIWTLHMPLRRKLAVSAIFSIGVVYVTPPFTSLTPSICDIADALNPLKAGAAPRLPGFLPGTVSSTAETGRTQPPAPLSSAWRR